MTLAINVVANGFNTASQATYTFNTQALGAEPGVDERRFMVLGFWTQRTTDAAAGVDALTINGVAAELVPGTEAFSHGTSGKQLMSAIYVAEVPTGTTGAVFFDFNGTCGDLLWGMGRIISDLNGINLVDVFAASGAHTLNSFSQAIDLVKDGCQFAYLRYSKTSTPTQIRHTGASRNTAADQADYPTAVVTSNVSPFAAWTDLIEGFDQVGVDGFQGADSKFVGASWGPVAPPQPTHTMRYEFIRE